MSSVLRSTGRLERQIVGVGLIWGRGRVLKEKDGAWKFIENLEAKPRTGAGGKFIKDPEQMV